MKKMTNLKSRVEEAYCEGRMYDFIADHYWEMSKEELKDILLEYVYAVMELSACMVSKEDLPVHILDNLNDVLMDD